MASPLSSPSQRRQRAMQLAHDWSVSPLTTPEASRKPARPLVPASFRKPADDAHAEQLLLRRRQSSSTPPTLSASHSTPLLNRSFTTKKSKSQETAKEVFETLLEYVKSGGSSAGVAEALLLRLQTLGGNLDVLPQKKSVSNLLSKRRGSGEYSVKRGQVLTEAVKGGSVDLVRVLVPHADPHSLDEAVGLAVKLGNVEVTEVLSCYGARVCESAVALDEFRTACIEGGHAELVGAMVRSEGRPSGVAVSQGMVDAARAGCVATVAYLARSSADGNYNNAEALKIAVGHGRRDVALAIVMGTSPPQRPGLDDAFALLFSLPNLSPDDRLALAELLLVAGAEGEAIDIGLIHAATAEHPELVYLLVSHGASTTFRDAYAVRNAVSKGQFDMLEILLSGPAPVGPENASRCVGLVPIKASYECRHAILTLLLRHGAGGAALHGALIDAVEVGDIESVRLLVTPEFPRPLTNGDTEVNGHSVEESHNVASVDHNGGLAFSIAVTRGDVPMTKLLLSAKPEQETISQVFPAACTLSAEESRYQIVEAFLLAGMTSQSLDVALQEAISRDPGQRDEKIISLLLSHDANINYANGAGLAAAIQQGDMGLVRTLVGATAPETAGYVLPAAMKVEDADVRREVVGLLLDAGAAGSKEKVAAALLGTISSRPVDVRLLKLLLDQGEADMSLGEGVVLGVALGDPDPTVVKMLLKHGQPPVELVRKHLETLTALPSTQSKTVKMQALLPLTTEDDRSKMLVQEVSSATNTPSEDFSLSPLEMLLSAGADVNGHKGRALCLAVGAGNDAIVKALLGSEPEPETLQLAFPHAIHNRETEARFAFTHMLVQAGVPKRESTRALAFCVDTYTDDIKLLTLLIENANIEDGIALGKAVKRGSPAIVKLLLEKGTSSQEALDNALLGCMEVKDREARLEICNLLLARGLRPAVVSSALLAAVNDVDFELGKVLIEAGGNLAECDSQGIVRACRSGSLDMLSLLLTGMPEPNIKVLQEAFQAATDLGDLKARTVIFEMLLRKGVSGEVVDEQLVSAARFGEAGTGMLKVLLEARADVDFNGGEAVCAAVRSAFLGNLELLLGRVVCHENQKRPSKETLSAALRASWKLSPETRRTTVEWLFEAGLTVGEDMDRTLVELANQEEGDLGLVEMLLEKGASPSWDGCRAIVDILSRGSQELMTLLLEHHVPEELDSILTRALREENVHSWCTGEGLSTLLLLLEKSDGERLGGETISTVLGLASTKPYELLDCFVDLLLGRGVDANHDGGKPLRLAASLGDISWVQKLLTGTPSSDPTPESLALGLASVFESPADEDTALALVTAFTEHESGVDAMYHHPVPLLIRALDRFPRSREILKALLDAGFYHDQMTTYPVREGLEPEGVTLLLWALLQPQKRVSSSVMALLIESGAKVGFESRVSGVTPLMVAIRERRADVVGMLLSHGADVRARDAGGATPLGMAVGLRGEAGVEITRRVLESGAPANDGSLHDAARELNLGTMEVLMESGHDPDFPSPLHGGRTALAELCRYGALDVREPKQEIRLEKVMGILLDRGSDLKIQSDGRSALLLALEGPNPVVVTRALLRSGMWRLINDEANMYRYGRFMYSATMYLRILPRTEHTDVLYALLRGYRCEDRFFAREGPQPDGAVGMPEGLRREEEERMRAAKRREEVDREHIRALQRARELHELETKLYISRMDLEASYARQKQKEELEFLEKKAKVMEGVERKAAERRTGEQERALAHEEAVTREVLARERSAAEVGVEGQERKAEAMVSGMVKVGLQRAENERGVLAIRGQGRGGGGLGAGSV